MRARVSCVRNFIDHFGDNVYLARRDGSPGFFVPTAEGFDIQITSVSEL